MRKKFLGEARPILLHALALGGSGHLGGKSREGESWDCS